MAIKRTLKDIDEDIKSHVTAYKLRPFNRRFSTEESFEEVIERQVPSVDDLQAIKDYLK